MASAMRERRILLAFPDSLGIEPRNRIGVFRYARPHCRWIFLSLNPNLPGFTRSAHAWRPHGAIGRMGREDLARKARGLGVPFVNIHGGEPFPGMAQVGTDDAAIGRLAADHLARLGFRRFGYFGLPEPGRKGFSSSREAAFVAALAERGRGAEVFDWGRVYPAKARAGARILRDEARWHRWLAWLPKPVAVFACDDLRAGWLLDSCYRIGLRVPDEVAVLGANGDDIYCQQAWPPLSTVRVPGGEEGYQAARLLERLLNGQRLPVEPILLAPEGVAVAASTDFVAVADPALAKALRFIRDRAAEGCGVEEVVRHAGVSRRVLENRFRRELGTTPFKEIRRFQVERVCRLLRETREGLDEVAERAGYSSRTRLATDFRQRMGVSPGRYRRQHGAPH